MLQFRIFFLRLLTILQHNLISKKEQMDTLKRRMSPTKQKTYDYLAKIVIIGNSAVGKTNILLRFINENYSIVHTPTVGVDFRSKVMEVAMPKESVKKRLKLQLWDTAGQERFRTLTDTYFKGASGIIIVYAINDRKSFEDVKDWIYQLEENGADKLPKVIVGNKCDLREERKVSSEEGRMLADRYRGIFMEVSAKEDINIEQMFTQLSMNIIHDLKAEIDESEGKPTKFKSVLVNQPKNAKKECCS